MNLSATWIETINNIDQNDWTHIFETNTIVNSYEFQKAVETSNLEKVKCLYLKINLDKELIGIISCFSYKFSLDVLANDFIKKCTGKIRKFYSNFLYQKMFFIGSPVATCEHMWGVKKFNDKIQIKKISDFIIKQIRIKANEEQCNAIIIKDIPSHQKDYISLFLNDRFKFFETLPNSFIPVGEDFFPYAVAFRKKNRYRYKTIKKSFETSEFTWTIQKEYYKFAQQIHNLYEQVLNKSSTRFENLNKDFFINLYKNLGKKTFALLCWNSKNELVGNVIIVEEHDSLLPLYLGLDYQYNDAGNIYFNCLYKTIEEAEKKNKKWVVAGQTTYLNKATSGALFERLYIAVYSDKTMFKLFINYFFKYFFPAFKLPQVRCYSKEFHNNLFIRLKKTKRHLEHCLIDLFNETKEEIEN